MLGEDCMNEPVPDRLHIHSKVPPGGLEASLHRQVVVAHELPEERCWAM
jgi:hypothetical protein